MDNTILKKIGLGDSLTDSINLNYGGASYYNSSSVKTSDGSNALTSSEAESKLKSITSSATDVATKIADIVSLKQQTEASINAYKLALDNNKTSLSTAEINYQIEQLKLQETYMETEEKKLRSSNSVINTKTIVIGLSVIAVASIIGIVVYNTKKK